MTPITAVAIASLCIACVLLFIALFVTLPPLFREAKGDLILDNAIKNKEEYDHEVRQRSIVGIALASIAIALILLSFVMFRANDLWLRHQQLTSKDAFSDVIY